MFSYFYEIFSYPFMQQAFLVSLVISCVCAYLSCFLVLKGWSLMGDAISHAVLPGIVLAYFLSIPLFIGAFIAGLLCTLLTGYFKEHSELKEDTSLGIAFTGLFALGLVLFTKIETPQHLMHILFGDLLGINHQEMINSLVIAIICLVFLVIKRKDLMLYVFDKTQATIAGLSTRLLYFGLLSALALIVVSAMQIVGIILIVGLLITPGITGFILTKNFTAMTLIAIGQAVISCFFGLILSYTWNSAPGPTIVLFQSFLFLIALAYISFKAQWKNNRLTSIELR